MKFNRIENMKNYIQEKEFVPMDDLINKYDVSLVTIRRDLKELETSGYIEKIYGGVIFKQENSLISFNQRQVENSNLKKIICKNAAKEIHENDYIYIDSGSTVIWLFDYIDINMRFTILTSNLHIINLAKKFKNINVIVIGGVLDRDANCFIPNNKTEVFNRININKAFMTTSGVSIEKGVTNKNLNEIEQKTIACRSAEKIFLLADHTKFNKYKLLTYIEMGGLDKIFTDQKLSEKYINFCNEHNIELIY